MPNGHNSLHRFVANNNDLEELEAQLNSFNPLKILRIENHEIRHSNILAWLLDPNGNHNLGSAFFKKFISEVIINNENLETDLEIFHVQDMPLTDLNVEREWNNIDILLSSNTSKVVILIENKVKAGESKGQLNRYYNLVIEHFKGYKFIPIFLSLDGSLPSDERYGAISHSTILGILKFIIKIQKENLNSKIYDFILYYLKILEVFTMENKKLKDLCKKIYKEHKEALDLIYDYREDTEFEGAAKKFIENISADEIEVKGYSAMFIPSKFQGTFELIGEEYWYRGRPFVFWFSRQKEKIGIILEIGPFKDEEKRRAFLDHLKIHKFTIKESSYKAGAKFTRIFSKYQNFNDWDNKDSIIDIMVDLYSKNAKNAENNLLEACSTFLW